MRRALLAFACCTALFLGSCKGEEEGAATSAEAVAPVAPPAGQQWFDVVATTPEGGWLVGNPDAPIKLIEYGSLTCPACAAFSQGGMHRLFGVTMVEKGVSRLVSVDLGGAEELLAAE